MALRALKPWFPQQGSLITIASFALALLAGCGGAHLISTSRATTRERLQLSVDEREHLRAGMRSFLESVGGITQGLAENQMQRVAKSAKRSGWSMMDASAAATALKLPPEFVAISIDTHQKFDDLAAEASAGATKAKVLADLTQILGNCTSCHAMYRLGPR